MSKKKKLPRVALCGRRNVGKSTLFNTLLGKNRALTDSWSGLTRDVLEAEIFYQNYHFLLSDTPGLDLESRDQLEEAVLNRAREHLRNMNLVLLLLEPPAPAAFDYVLLDLLRNENIPFIVVVNKVDGIENEYDRLVEFYQLGLKDIIPVSARGRRNMDRLLETMSVRLPEMIGVERPRTETQEESKRERSTVISDRDEDDIRIAIVGRPNAGKSSLFNRLINKELSLVSEIPGTTRDTIDTVFAFHGHKIRMIDTAGMRRSSYLRGQDRRVDFYSVGRARRAIMDSHIVIHLIDAVIGITDFDKKIAALIGEYKKPVVLGVNKWDTVADKDQDTMKRYIDRLNFVFPHTRKIPIVFCSALTGQRIGKLIEMAIHQIGRLQIRPTTSRLNSLLQLWNKRLKAGSSSARILYAAQAEGTPPTFILFVNSKKLFRKSVLTYFENCLRDELDLHGIPLTFIIKEREGK